MGRTRYFILVYVAQPIYLKGNPGEGGLSNAEKNEIEMIENIQRTEKLKGSIDGAISSSSQHLDQNIDCLMES